MRLPLVFVPKSRNHNAALFAIVVFFSFFGGSCSRMNLGDPGPNTRIFRSISAEKGIRIGQQFNVTLIQDSTQPEGYWIEYPEKLIPNITHTIKDGVWHIRDENAAKWTQDLNRKPIITVNLRKYENLYIDGSSTWLCADTLYAERLQINMNSVMNHEIWINCNELTGKCENLGSLTLAGKGTIVSFTAESGSQVKAQNLSSHDVYFWHFTQRDCYISPEKQAELYLYNSGNLYIKPHDFYRYQVSEKGTGRVITKP